MAFFFLFASLTVLLDELRCKTRAMASNQRGTGMRVRYGSEWRGASAGLACTSSCTGVVANWRCERRVELGAG